MEMNLNYTDKSFTVSGSTKEYKDQLMALGGRYNPHLKTGPGYVFSNNKKEEVINFINNSTNSFIEKKDIKVLPTPIYPVKPKMKSSLQSTTSTLEYPNRFTGSDNLQYQIIILTCPLPYLNQRITVKYTDGSFDGVVSSINDGSPVNDIVISYEEENTIKQTRAVILNEKWQIYLLDVNHEVIFHQ